jgi:GTPase SAR1 family protein
MTIQGSNGSFVVIIVKGVGKSTFLKQFVGSEYKDQSQVSTVGMEFGSTRFMIKESLFYL